MNHTFNPPRVSEIKEAPWGLNRAFAVFVCWLHDRLVTVVPIFIQFSSCRSVATSAYDGRGGRDYRHYPRESGSKSDGEQNTRQRRQQHYYRGHRSRAGLSDTYVPLFVLLLSLHRVPKNLRPVCVATVEELYVLLLRS